MRVYDGLKYLKTKGRLFSEDDKKILEDVQKSILKSIIPLYRELAEKGIIELSTSPFYHPIVPLLIDSNIARESMPNAALPERPFVRPEDASHQIDRAVKLFREVFQNTPQGMWPPEGSVSDDALQLYMEQGVKWLATDEDILFESLKWESRRDGSGFLTHPEILYKPYRYEKKGKHIDMIFPGPVTFGPYILSLFTHGREECCHGLPEEAQENQGFCAGQDKKTSRYYCYGR